MGRIGMLLAALIGRNRASRGPRYGAHGAVVGAEPRADSDAPLSASG